MKEKRDLTKKKKEERNPNDKKGPWGLSGGSKKTREKILIAFPKFPDSVAVDRSPDKPQVRVQSTFLLITPHTHTHTHTHS